MRRTLLSRRFVTFVLCAGLYAPALSMAALVEFQAFLDGAQETPSVTTDATGTGSFTFDTDTSLFTWDVSFTGLSSAETNAHIHLGAVGVPGGVVFGLGLGSPKIGERLLSATETNDLFNELWYVNIHSVNYPGGEIRGQVTVVPLPAAVWLLGSGILALGLYRRRATAS